MDDLTNGLEEVSVPVQTSAERTLPDFQYSPENVRGPGCAVDPAEVTLPGCSCVCVSCSDVSCSCLQTHQHTYNSDGTLRNLRRRKAAAVCTPVFECNVLCACSDSCSNRRVQRGLRLSVEVFSTSNRGWGLRTLQHVPRGTFVCEYAGEVISFEEARRRTLAQTCDDSNYIIAVSEHAGSGSITRTFVDPRAVGNVGRFLNHSCAPNLFMVPVRVHSVVPRLALFAGRDIAAEEELTFDYSGGEEVGGTTALRRKVCHCGADSCARFLPLDSSVLS